MKTLLGFWFCAFIVIALATQVQAGEYYTYRDAEGKLVISNKEPPAGSKIIKQQTLMEVTDAQLKEARQREESLRNPDTNVAVQTVGP